METHILYANDIKNQDLTIFVKLIYNNFIELTEDTKLMHNKEKIEENKSNIQDSTEDKEEDEEQPEQTEIDIPKDEEKPKQNKNSNTEYKKNYNNV